ncbi:hypothetical protein N7468_003832 [Penicillium chermesinum]|uniref:Endonuclease/exonuclease/phosphatase domain-containing protein n=1 Tax=Penicillium chermesinum TaxID=63820 RepID=A0A9W9TSM1_9EURO|nr:uncharacterized protein N7468_003832 [Penicillium chermesinum]KAJ5239213.1 hypothetical protein N7468_003832 [Penicillium chermesinum]
MRSSPVLPIRVLTHNVRHLTDELFQGELHWSDRSQLVINELNYHSRGHNETFICLQEVLHEQLNDILEGLNLSSSQKWSWIGPSIWDLLCAETVWLSETPTKPSKSWDSASIRIVTIGVFNHKISGSTVLALNTHLDDQGSRARLEGARIIRAKIQQYHQGTYGPLLSGTFLTGDLNSEETQEAYLEFTQEGGLLDTYKLVPTSQRYGDHNTYTGFGYEGEPPTRIDFVLLVVGGNQKWRTDGYSVLQNKFDGEVLNSDHRAVVADLALVK